MKKNKSNIKSILFIVCSLFFSKNTFAQVACTDTASFSPALAIPDNDPIGVTDAQTVAGIPGTTLGFDVRLVKACFNITHTWVGDLIVTLNAPNGTSVVLMDRPGFPALAAGCDGDDVDACIVLGTGNEMENVCNNLPAISGDYTAANGSDLDAINAAAGSPNGSWSVSVSDNANLDTGTLISWQLIFDSGPSPAWSPSSDSICATAGTINLNSLLTGTPGGAWTGSGVTDSIFDPTGLSGNITITYSVTNGTCTGTQSNVIFVAPTTPACSFTVVLNNTTAVTTNTTTSAVAYSWDFGDGSPLDNTVNPIHNYTINGTYTITLSATNVCGTVTCTQTVTVAGCPDVILDGGFEAGSPSVVWTEASTNFGTPLCTVATCGVGTGTGPHNGSTWWAWFGGLGTALEEGSLTQTITLPASSTANLAFYLEQILCDDPVDFLDVIIDGTDTIFHTDGSSALCGVLGYSLQTVNMDAYCDGNAHTIQLHSITFGTNGTPSNYFVDDVSILSCPVGISEQSIAQEITVLPNPANEFIAISMKGIKTDNISISIYNALGQNVYESSVDKVAGNYSKQINVSKWSKGVYILKLQSDNKNITRNIVIQ